MGLIKEFKEFTLKGNVIDLAVGIIIGGAFGGIVKALIDDVIMPPLGLALKGADFKNLYYPLGFQGPATADIEAARKMGPVIAYGDFITVVINFIILALCIFLMVKAFNTARKRFEAEKPAVPPAPTPEQKLLMEIRDLLARR